MLPVCRKSFILCQSSCRSTYSKSGSISTIRLGVVLANLSMTLSTSSLLVMSLWQKSRSKAFILSWAIAFLLADLMKPRAELALSTVAEVTGRSRRRFIKSGDLGSKLALLWKRLTSELPPSNQVSPFDLPTGYATLLSRLLGWMDPVSQAQNVTQLFRMCHHLLVDD